MFRRDKSRRCGAIVWLSCLSCTLSSHPSELEQLQGTGSLRLEKDNQKKHNTIDQFYDVLRTHIHTNTYHRYIDMYADYSNIRIYGKLDAFAKWRNFV